MTRLIQLSVRNFKNLTAIELPINQGATIIAGENGAGKTSILDAIEALIRGADAFPEMAIRRGANKCELSGTFDNGYKVDRVISQGKTKLSVTGPDGKPPKGGAQTFLNGLINARAFDPNSFAEAPAKTQVETVRRVTGLDTKAIDQQIQMAFDMRTNINRDVEQLRARVEAAPVHKDAPIEPVDVKDLVESLRKVAEVKKANDDRRKALETKQEADAKGWELHREAIEAMEKILDEIERLNGALVAANERTRLIHSNCLAADSATAEIKSQVDALIDPDPKPIEDQIAGAAEANKKLTDNQARAELIKQYEQAAQDASALTELIKEKRDARTALISEAKMPIEGLDVTDSEVTVNGVPIKQLSHSQQMEIGVAIEAATNPELRLLVVREAYACGAKRLKAIIDIAVKRDFDVILEVLDESIPGAIIIEEGAIVGQSQPGQLDLGLE